LIATRVTDNVDSQVFREVKIVDRGVGVRA